MSFQDTKINLILGNKEEALLSLESGNSELGFIVAELIRMDEEKLSWEEYEEALFNIYRQENVEKALRIVKGEESLVNTIIHSNYKKMLSMYDRLEYKKQTVLFPLESN